MSAYITLPTPMVDRGCLVEALTKMGFSHGQIEVHDEAVPLIGYDARGRGRVGHVVIRRQHVGPASNDIGFVETATGFQAHISDFDRSRYGASWLRQLATHHATLLAEKEARLAEAERQRLAEERRRLVEAQRLAVRAKAKRLGYRVKETRTGDAVRLVLVKRVY